jgi:hypothetical protein
VTCMNRFLWTFQISLVRSSPLICAFVPAEVLYGSGRPEIALCDEEPSSNPLGYLRGPRAFVSSAHSRSKEATE